MKRAVLALALVACKSGGSAGGDDAASIDTAISPDASLCKPLERCDWLDDYERRIVGTLSGQFEVSPGVRLLHRESVSERDITRQFLIDELTALGYTPTRAAYGTGTNVLARLPSTQGNAPIVIVGAHFDGVAVGPAAADDATGTAMVLAVARYLKDMPNRAHAVEFALFDEEELGLVGSKAYVQNLVNMTAMVQEVHIFDMVSFDGDGDGAVELWSPSTEIRTKYIAAGNAAGIPIQPVTFPSSDHTPFLNAGYVATGVSEEFVANDHTPHYHKATDTYDKINFAYLEKVTQLAFKIVEASVITP